MRKAVVKRKTKETDIAVSLNLDGEGRSRIETPFPFFSHMLSAFSKHGLVDLSLTAKGDVDVDDHHTIEDMGIVLGQALDKGLGEKLGIARFGFALVPLDEALARVVVDLSGRPYLVYHAKLPKKKIKEFDIDMVEHFFKSLVDHSKVTLHIELLYGRYPHHCLEAIFKAFGRAFQMAARIDPRRRGAPSTKGML